MTDIKSMNMEELKELMVQIGEKPFRAKQIYGWLHEHLVTSYDEMANIPKSLKEKLKDYPITVLEELDVQTSKVDGTRKYLFRLSDGNMIESVLMRYKYGNSVCISSQAGCRMGCRFCASTIGGLTRNLLPSEMLDQIYRIQTSIGERISNVVVMGTGEPLDNYDNLLRFIHILTEDGGIHISQRNLTVSTCGLVPRIYELADENGIIEYKGTVFVCDDEHGALCLGDMSDESNVLSIPLAGGGTLKVNRNNKADLARAIGMFKPEDVRRIMVALAQDNKVQEMENEIEDEKNSIGTGQENQRKQE